ncbi:MAG TPA: MFS transporter [Anaerolineales bacterium]|nr:MFS transporter [Anaerolineales bacterium]
MASYVDGGAIVATGTALVLYQSTLDLNEVAIGILSGLLTLFFALGAVVGGRFGDLFGRRRVFTVSLVLYAVGITALMLAVYPAMLYIGVVLTGIAIGADLPVSLALIAEEAPEGMKGRLVAFSGFLWFIGIIVTSILTAIVGPLGDLGGRILYAHLLVVAVVVLVLQLGLPESREWAAAQRAKATGHDEIRFSDIPQMFAPPLLFTILALGLYIGVWELTANTFSQFGTFIWVNLAGGTVQGQALIGLGLLPIGIGAALIFMRIVDRPSRRHWFIIGTSCYIVAFAIPAVAGVNIPTLIALQLLFSIGASFSGTTIYKVWSQELVPTLLRSTAQGLTIAFARLVAALFAFLTPTLLMANSSLAFGLLFAFAVISAAIGLFWVPQLPRATELEPTVAVFVPESGPYRLHEEARSGMDMDSSIEHESRNPTGDLAGRRS